jgi:hypothetical protein
MLNSTAGYFLILVRELRNFFHVIGSVDVGDDASDGEVPFLNDGAKN